VYALPGTKTPQYTMTDAYVAATSNQASQQAITGVGNLTAFMVALSDPNHYGHLLVWKTPQASSVLGPLLAQSKMLSDHAASSQITLLNREGSTVTLGNVLMVPIDGSMLYVCPMYVTSNATKLPILQYQLTEYKNRVGFNTSLLGSLAQVLPGLSAPPSQQQQTLPQLIATAASQWQHAQAALAAKDLGAYQKYVNAYHATSARIQAMVAAQKAHASSGT